jgi:hypothetical protein
MPASASGIRAGKAYVELGTDNSGLSKGLKNATAKLQSFGGSLTSVGKKLLAVGAGIGGPLLAAAKVFASVGSEMQDLSEKTGASVESLSGLKYAAEQSGVGVDALATGFKKMQKTIGDASDGVKESQEELTSLGLTTQQLKGMSPDQQFKAFAHAISKIPDPAQRATAAMTVFGKSGADLLPLLNQGASGIDAFVAHAKEMGLIISGADAKSAKQFQQSLSDLWAVVSQGVFVVGGALAPVLKGIVQSIAKVIVSATAWIKEHKQLIIGALAAAAAIAGFGAAILSIGTLISTVAAVFATLGTIFSIVMAPLGIIFALLGALASPVGIVIAALVGLGVAWAKMTASGQAAISSLGALFGRLWSEFSVAFGGIKDALSAGDLGLAARIAFAGLRVAMLEGVAGIADAVGGEMGDFVGSLGTQLAGGNLAGAWQTMLKGMSAAWASFSQWVVGVAASVAHSIIAAWAKVAGVIANVIQNMIESNDGDELKTKANAERLKAALHTRKASIDLLPEDEQKKIYAAMTDRERAEIGVDRGEHHEAAGNGTAKASDDIAAQAGKIGAAIDDWKQTADANAKAANDALSHATAGGAKKSHDALDAGNAELARLRAEAARKATEKRLQDAKEGARKNMGEAGEGVQKKLSVAGNFNAAAIRGMAGASTAAERTAKATEKSKMLLEQLVAKAGADGRKIAFGF